MTGSSPSATASGHRRAAAALAVGNLETLGADSGARRAVRAIRRAATSPDPYEPAPAHQPRVLVTERDSNQSHLRMSYRPAIDVTDPAQRAALTIYSTLLGGSMGSRLFDEIREQRGLCYSVSSYPHAYADVPVLQLSSGLESAKCVEAYRRMARDRRRAARGRPDRGRGRARPRLCRRRPCDRVREHRRDRTDSCDTGDRLRPGCRS